MHRLKLLSVFCLWGATALPGLAAERYAVSGIVRAMLSPTELVIAHEEIPGFMPAMTMAFTLDEALRSGTVELDDRISGTLIVEAGDMRLTDIRRLGQAKAIVSGPAPSKAVILAEGDTVPSFVLENQKGEADNVFDAGTYTIATFIFTRCPVPDFCPLMSSRFASLQNAIQEGAIQSPTRLLSLTLDPEFDTPDRLKAYGEAYKADDRVWTLARASVEETDRLVRAFRVFRERDGALLDHTLATALIAPDGTLIKIWRGNGWTPDEVVAAVNAAEFSEQK